MLFSVTPTNSTTSTTTNFTTNLRLSQRWQLRVCPASHCVQRLSWDKYLRQARQNESGMRKVTDTLQMSAVSTQRGGMLTFSDFRRSLSCNAMIPPPIHLATVPSACMKVIRRLEQARMHRHVFTAGSPSHNLHICTCNSPTAAD